MACAPFIPPPNETPQDRFERLTRWMRENILLATGIYRRRKRSLAVDPRLRVTRHGVTQRMDRGLKARKNKGWMLNSGAALVCCCYINALGKVVWSWEGRSRPARLKDRSYFLRFIQRFMLDLWDESMNPALPFPSVPNDIQTIANAGTYCLYKTFRCGFVHQFAPAAAGWCRGGQEAPYWHEIDGSIYVNLDRLAAGALSGLREFQIAVRQQATPQNGLYQHFGEWLLEE